MQRRMCIFYWKSSRIYHLAWWVLQMLSYDIASPSIDDEFTFGILCLNRNNEIISGLQLLIIIRVLILQLQCHDVSKCDPGCMFRCVALVGYKHWCIHVCIYDASRFYAIHIYLIWEWNIVIRMGLYSVKCLFCKTPLYMIHGRYIGYNND